jgi:hypothetical protein
MSLDALNAAAAFATVVLLGLTAIAAIIQLRHLRASNELAAVLAIERDFRSPEIQSALVYVQRELAQRMEDPAYRSGLTAPGYVDEFAHPELVLCNWFNRTGSLVRAGLLKEDLFLNSFGRLVVYYWQLLGPVVAVFRRTRGDGQYAAFEFLAYRAGVRLRARRSGRGPATPQAPLTNPWPTA